MIVLVLVKTIIVFGCRPLAPEVRLPLRSLLRCCDAFISTVRTPPSQRQYYMHVFYGFNYSYPPPPRTAYVQSHVHQDASFESLCYKPIEGEGCLVESPSQYWLNDPILLAGDAIPSLTAACQTSDAFLASRSPCMDEVTSVDRTPVD